MIETEQSVAIAAPIGAVWDFARDIRKWADLMPGLKDCDVIDDDNSRWTLKVGVGGLVRTVKVRVHVDQWDGPGKVLFTYQLEGDPVSGGGAYTATELSPDRTQVALAVRVAGSGPMAPMWEAMGRPLLPQFAKGFAEQFRDKIEATLEPRAGGTPSLDQPRARRSALGRLWASIRSAIGRLFGGGKPRQVEPRS
jgi:carbon monoxide dehydrogenase subunit G